MGKSRLWDYPEKTLELIKAVMGGSKTKSTIADSLEISESTVNNRLHDPVCLGLIQKDKDRCEVSEEGKKAVQLNDKNPIKNSFVNLPGVNAIQEKIEEKDEIDIEEIGRLVSFETDSDAASKNTFKKYGRIYAQWFDFLGMAYKGKYKLYKNSEDVKGRKGANNLRVRPKKVKEVMKKIPDCKSTQKLAKKLGYTEKYTGKILSTLYTLSLAKRKTASGIEITETGRAFNSASLGKKKEMIRKKLAKIPLFKAYLQKVPEGEYSHKAIIEEISEEHLLGWQKVTIETHAKIMYSWLLYTGIVEEIKSGVLKTTSNIESLDFSGSTQL